ncbi:hypothetical protein NECAME_17627 [Necator americanus]|uniref:Condensation domain-containing protein n=1 Tax=Necator americanus TaxID=51031 RepID=W2TMF4_NECAM|nr:hypothetical protein NECAME_17627 [Necator americanus]ETN82829.1 hypothetical protein NECAME_17627 [Necator americanus]
MAELEMQIQKEYPSYTIPTGVLLSHPTVEEMDTYLFSCAYEMNLNINKDVSAYMDYIIPLSPQQRRLVFMCELDPESSAQFNEPVVFSMRSKSFDEEKFVSVLNLIVMRHTILRTIYIGNNQVVCSGTEAFLANRMLDTEPKYFVAQPIDIKRTSAHFAISSSPDRIVICLVFHHVAVDGYSISIITEEMKAFYVGEELSAPSGQYSDYAKKSSQSLYQLELGKWREKLKGKSFQLLPTDRPRTAKQTFDGSSIQKSLPVHLHESLKKLRNLGNCTDFCILVATYKFLVYKTTGIGDFPVGFPSSLRGEEFSRTVGCFVNTLPLLGIVDSSVAPGEYLKNIFKAISEARNMDVPLDLIVSELKLERDDAVSPLFQVLLVMDIVDVSSSDDDIVFIDLPSRFSKYEQI